MPVAEFGGKTALQQVYPTNAAFSTAATPNATLQTLSQHEAVLTTNENYAISTTQAV